MKSKPRSLANSMPADVGTHLPEFVSDDVNDEVPEKMKCLNSIMSTEKGLELTNRLVVFIEIMKRQLATNLRLVKFISHFF